MTTEPTQLATDLDVTHALEAVRDLSFVWLPEYNFDWCRMDSTLNRRAEPWASLLAPYAQEGDHTRTRVTIMFPGGRIVPHHDHLTHTVHVVLATDPASYFHFPPDTPFHMPARTAWLLPISRHHTGWNAGTKPRIHLVADYH